MHKNLDAAGYLKRDGNSNSQIGLGCSLSFGGASEDELESATAASEINWLSWLSMALQMNMSAIIIAVIQIRKEESKDATSKVDKSYRSLSNLAAGKMV